MKKANLKISKIGITIVASLLVILCVSFCACSQKGTNGVDTSYVTESQPTGMKTYDGYTLEHMDVLSRHNIRSPLTGAGSTLNKLTPHEWFNWTAKSSELSLQGGELETMMGQYFRKYLENLNYIPENWIPQGDEALFYSNSYQRTIATAQYFSSGMLPIGNVDVVHKYALNEQDKLFLPFQTYMNDKLKAQIMKEIEAMGGEKGLNGILENLSEEFKTLEYALDFKDSDYAKEHNITSFPLDDLKINIVADDELTCEGSLKLGNTASDAFKLQYYEEEDDAKAAFGKKLSYDQWLQIGKIADVYEKVLFGAHSAAINAAHPMLQELQKDMNNPNRKFTYLCGHDSTILSVVTALGVSDYELPNAISKLTPIGVKLVVEKWKNAAGEEFASLSLVYASVDQLRHRLEPADFPPCEYQLSLDGLEKNADGLYKWSDIQNRFSERIAEYDKYK